MNRVVNDPGQNKNPQVTWCENMTVVYDKVNQGKVKSMQDKPKQKIKRNFEYITGKIKGKR